MNLFVYDGTFEGLLCAVFESYERKQVPDRVVATKQLNHSLFDTEIIITSDAVKAERVWKSLQNKLSAQNRQLAYHAFLYDHDQSDQTVFDFIRLVFDTPHSIDHDFSNPVVLKMRQIKRIVTKEAMRLIQFVRFQKTADGIYFAALSPDFETLPLITQFFVDRYQDQQWIIYDLKRGYGIYYDLNETREITLDVSHFSRSSGDIHENIMEEGEANYQHLWQDYIQAVTIRERLNPRLQLQHMPRRYWKHLTEMKKK